METLFILTQGNAVEIKLSYEYDPAGRVTAVSDRGIRTEYTYDPAGRLYTERSGYTGISTQYSYTPAGNLTALRYFNGEELLDNYEYLYDKRGNQIEKIENGNSTAYHYDPLSRIKTVIEENGAVLHYEYDDLGNISTAAEIGPGGIAETQYTYDLSSRMLLASTTDQSEVSNQFFNYDAQGNQILKATTISRDGVPVTAWAQEFFYNGYNQLSFVIEQDEATPGSTRIAAYQYNGEGLRTSSEVNGYVTRYTYDRGNIVLETDQEHKITATNVRDSRHLLYREIDQDTSDPTTYYYQFNGHGDVTKLSDLFGAIIKDYRYDPCGNEEEDLIPGFGGAITTALWQQEESQIDNPFRYCGEYLDSETNTYYLRARNYDPTIGRFLSEDSVSYVAKDLPNEQKAVDPLSLNLYTYCYNNPVRYTDSSGNIPVETIIDFASIGWSFKEFVKKPSLVNAGLLLWDIGAFCIPYAPGSYVTKGLKIAENADDAMDAAKAVKSGLKADFGKKLEYVFGNATGAKHNIDRSIAMEKQLNSIGIFDNKAGRELVQDNLTKAFSDPSSILKVQDNGRIVRESLISGPNGLVKIESIWEDAKLITIQIFGGK